MGDYPGVANDPDINKYEQSDIQDLTESGLGETIRSLVVWIPLIVLIVVVIWFKMKGKQAIKK